MSKNGSEKRPLEREELAAQVARFLEATRNPDGTKRLRRKAFRVSKAEEPEVEEIDPDLIRKGVVLERLDESES